MGGCDFVTTGFGKDAKEAYQNAKERAIWEHGNDPYNGTISTTSGFSIRKIEGRQTEKAIDQMIEKVIENADKRECVCIPLAGAALKKAKERAGLKGKKVNGYIFAGIAAE